jgi:hypothetical protein
MHGRGTYYYTPGVGLSPKQHADDGKNKKKGSPVNSAASNPDVQSCYDGEFRDGAR